MSLLSGLDDFWLEVSCHSLRFRRKAYNITSLPEQFEMFHNYHQHGSQRPIGHMVSAPVGGDESNIRGEEGRNSERSR
jgi:hypothetical protein